jgi:hypothetical protein
MSQKICCAARSIATQTVADRLDEAALTRNIPTLGSALIPKPKPDC